MLDAVNKLDEFYDKYNLSTAYIYSLLNLCEDAQNIDKNFTCAMWRSKLFYRTQRFVETNTNITEEDKERITTLITQHIGSFIEQYKKNYIITLFTWLYKHREN